MQGSDVGPNVFLIYINELVFVLEQRSIKVNQLFADDIKMYVRILDDTDVWRLQSDLYAVARLV